VVTDLTPRTAMLSSFNSGSASGDWTLFVADMSTGDTHTLQSWSITVTGDPIPEPGAASLLAIGAVVWSLRRSGRRSH
jgi:subtilisin-like proprotein convertase family protein